MKALEPACIEAGITVLNEIGLDPGKFSFFFSPRSKLSPRDLHS